MDTSTIGALDITAVLGLVFGVTGTTLGVLNYLRDRATIVISLTWDMTVTPGTEYDHRKKWGLIHVSNVGRRPIFVSHVALRLPKGFESSHLVIMEGITGVKLAEGDPTRVYMVSQDGLAPYATKWRGIRAQITDSSGKDWISKRAKKERVPSWVTAPVA